MYSGFSETNEQPTSNTLGPPSYLDKAQGISITLSVAPAPYGKFRLNSTSLRIRFHRGPSHTLIRGHRPDVSAVTDMTNSCRISGRIFSNQHTPSCTIVVWRMYLPGSLGAMITIFQDEVVFAGTHGKSPLRSPSNTTIRCVDS